MDQQHNIARALMSNPEPGNSAGRMVRLTAQGGGKDEKAKDVLVYVEVAHLHRNMGMFACLSRDFLNYFQLGNFGADGWKIVHAF